MRCAISAYANPGATAAVAGTARPAVSRSMVLAGIGDANSNRHGMHDNRLQNSASVHVPVTSLAEREARRARDPRKVEEKRSVSCAMH